MNIFKERLKELRDEREITQTELAKATGISQAAIARWEIGVRTPNMDNLIVLAKYFNCSIDYLVGLEI